jgi:8-oxo-dGTP pyrophosphatase MutT (NUDIX family)
MERASPHRIRPEHLRRAMRLSSFDARAATGPMTPSRRGRPLPRPEGTPWREGGALLYAFEVDGVLSFPMTLRRDDLPEHRGQVSLPGGRPHGPEPLWDAALREAREEIGLDVPGIERLGVLAPVEIPHTGSRLHVHVAMGTPPAPFRPDPREVARIVVVGLDLLVDPVARGTALRRIDGADPATGGWVEVPCFLLGGLEVWGATAMALSELSERLRRALGTVTPASPGSVPST